MPLSNATLKGLAIAGIEKIAKVTAREILDSRGNPTVEVDLTTEVRAHTPSSPVFLGRF